MQIFCCNLGDIVQKNYVSDHNAYKGGILDVCRTDGMSSHNTLKVYFEYIVIFIKKSLYFLNRTLFLLILEQMILP